MDNLSIRAECPIDWCKGQAIHTCTFLRSRRNALIRANNLEIISMAKWFKWCIQSSFSPSEPQDMWALHRNNFLHPPFERNRLPRTRLQIILIGTHINTTSPIFHTLGHGHRPISPLRYSNDLITTAKTSTFPPFKLLFGYFSHH